MNKILHYFTANQIVMNEIAPKYLSTLDRVYFIQDKK